MSRNLSYAIILPGAASAGGAIYFQGLCRTAATNLTPEELAFLETAVCTHSGAEFADAGGMFVSSCSSCPPAAATCSDPDAAFTVDVAGIGGEYAQLWNNVNNLDDAGMTHTQWDGVIPHTGVNVWSVNPQNKHLAGKRLETVHIRFNNGVYKLTIGGNRTAWEGEKRYGDTPAGVYTRISGGMIHTVTVS